jgi:hypothetical protein
LLSNAIADGVFRALDNVDTAVELNTPSLGMFDSIINVLKSMRKVFVFQNLLLLLIRVKVESAKKWTFSQMKVLMLEEPLKKKKDFEHFGNPFTLQLV